MKRWRAIKNPGLDLKATCPGIAGWATPMMAAIAPLCSIALVKWCVPDAIKT